MKPISFDPEAEDELQAAWRWYSERNSSKAIDVKLLRIQRSPAAFPSSSGQLGDSAFGVHSSYFTELEAELRVLAIAHQRRQPGYWRKRLGH